MRAPSANAKKCGVDGDSEARLLLRWVEVCDESGTSSLPPAKTLRADEFLASCDFDHTVKRISLKEIQEFRAKVDHWSL